MDGTSGVTTFEEFLEIETRYLNSQYDAYYRRRGFSFRRVNLKGHDVEFRYNGTMKKIEEKTRLDVYSDMLVEEIQDIDSGSKGWIYYCDADYLLYGFAYSYPPHRIHLAYVVPDFKRFRSWYLSERDRFKEYESCKGFGRTLFRVVSLRELRELCLIKMLWSEDGVL